MESKTYKHKKKGRSAKQRIGTDEYDVGDEIAVRCIAPKELIEDSEDREEIVLEDWIDDARKICLKDRNFNELLLQGHKKCFRQAIEKHAPKVKKFTEQEVQRWNEMNFRMCPDTICDFLRVNGLLEE